MSLHRNPGKMSDVTSHRTDYTRKSAEKAVPASDYSSLTCAPGPFDSEIITFLSICEMLQLNILKCYLNNDTELLTANCGNSRRALHFHGGAMLSLNF